jgi:hypothetical protein
MALGLALSLLGAAPAAAGSAEVARRLVADDDTTGRGCGRTGVPGQRQRGTRIPADGAGYASSPVASETQSQAPPRWAEAANGLVVLGSRPLDGLPAVRPEYAGYAGGQVKQADVVLLTYPWVPAARRS